MGRVVIRIGDAPITDVAVSHWVSVADASQRLSQNAQATRQEALERLVSLHWLIDEASARGEQPLGPTIRRRRAEKQAILFPGGAAEEKQFLRVSKQTGSDLELEAAAELAAETLRHFSVVGTGVVRAKEIAAYYERHKNQFMVPERREVLITNRKSNGAAEQVIHEVRDGKSLASIAQHEWVRLPSVKREAILDSIIGSTPLHELSAPVKMRVDYFVFEVEKILPVRQLSLAQARDSIARQLLAERNRRSRSQFAAALEKKWRSRTDCAPGYVVSVCRQYTGPVVRKAELLSLR